MAVLRRFLVSFMVDARGGAMRGCRHSGVRVIIPPRKAAMPMRITCRYLKKDKLVHAPPLMEGEALASRILEMGPAGAKFLGPVIIEVPHFASLRGKEREIVILRSDNGETWREHTLEATEEAVQEVLNESFDGEELKQLEDLNTNRITRILTTDFPQYFAIVTRIRQEVHAIGPEGGMVSSTVVPQVQAVFPQGALTKKIKVGLQAQPISPELVAKLLGNRVAVSPIVTVEPRRRKFHKPITLTIPVPQAASKGMINQYSGEAPTLRLLCSITGGTTRAQWEDVTGSTPLTFVNDCVSFTTTVSARFWLMDCTNIPEATKMATELYREAIHVPFMAKFVVFSKRHQLEEARVRVFCMTDDKEDKTLETQEQFVEIAKSRDVEVLEGKPQYLEFAGNLVPVTKSGDQLAFNFYAFRENRLPFTVRVKDLHADPVGRVAFMRQPKVGRGDPPQTPICNLNIALPENIQPEPAPSEPDLLALEKKYTFLSISKADTIHKADLRLSDISNMLSNDWVALARELEISDSDINIIKSQYQDNAPQQALVMLRLWMQTAGNKATGNTLEKCLRKIGRDDIVNQCIFNVELVTDDLERAMAKAHLDQSGFDSLRTELGPQDAVLNRDVSMDVSYDEKDMMKEAESAEEEEDVQRSYQEKGGRDQPTKTEVLSPTYEREEKKYAGEEKIVLEEKLPQPEVHVGRVEGKTSVEDSFGKASEDIKKFVEEIDRVAEKPVELKELKESKPSEKATQEMKKVEVETKKVVIEEPLEKTEAKEKYKAVEKEPFQQDKVTEEKLAKVSEVEGKIEFQTEIKPSGLEAEIPVSTVSTTERSFTTADDGSVQEHIIIEKRTTSVADTTQAAGSSDKADILQKLGEELGRLDEKLEEKFKEKRKPEEPEESGVEEVSEVEIVAERRPQVAQATTQIVVDTPEEEVPQKPAEVSEPSVVDIESDIISATVETMGPIPDGFTQTSVVSSQMHMTAQTSEGSVDAANADVIPTKPDSAMTATTGADLRKAPALCCDGGTERHRISSDDEQEVGTEEVQKMRTSQHDLYGADIQSKSHVKLSGHNNSSTRSCSPLTNGSLMHLVKHSSPVQITICCETSVTVKEVAIETELEERYNETRSSVEKVSSPENNICHSGHGDFMQYTQEEPSSEALGEESVHRREKEFHEVDRQSTQHLQDLQAYASESLDETATPSAHRPTTLMITLTSTESSGEENDNLANDSNKNVRENDSEISQMEPAVETKESESFACCTRVASGHPLSSGTGAIPRPERQQRPVSRTATLVKFKVEKRPLTGHSVRERAVALNTEPSHQQQHGSHAAEVHVATVEDEVIGLMAEVKAATSQIKEEVKQLRQTNTPTPDTPTPLREFKEFLSRQEEQEQERLPPIKEIGREGEEDITTTAGEQRNCCTPVLLHSGVVAAPAEWQEQHNKFELLSPAFGGIAHMGSKNAFVGCVDVGNEVAEGTSPSERPLNEHISLCSDKGSVAISSSPVESKSSSNVSVGFQTDKGVGSRFKQLVKKASNLSLSKAKSSFANIISKEKLRGVKSDELSTIYECESSDEAVNKAPSEQLKNGMHDFNNKLHVLSPENSKRDLEEVNDEVSLSSYHKSDSSEGNEVFHNIIAKNNFSVEDVIPYMSYAENYCCNQFSEVESEKGSDVESQKDTFARKVLEEASDELHQMISAVEKAILFQDSCTINVHDLTNRLNCLEQKVLNISSHDILTARPSVVTDCPDHYSEGIRSPISPDFCEQQKFKKSEPYGLNNLSDDIQICNRMTSDDGSDFYHREHGTSSCKKLHKTMLEVHRNDLSDVSAREHVNRCSLDLPSLSDVKYFDMHHKLSSIGVIADLEKENIQGNISEGCGLATNGEDLDELDIIEDHKTSGTDGDFITADTYVEHPMKPPPDTQMHFPLLDIIHLKAKADVMDSESLNIDSLSVTEAEDQASLEVEDSGISEESMESSDFNVTWDELEKFCFSQIAGVETETSESGIVDYEDLSYSNAGGNDLLPQTGESGRPVYRNLYDISVAEDTGLENEDRKVMETRLHLEDSFVGQRDTEFDPGEGTHESVPADQLPTSQTSEIKPQVCGHPSTGSKAGPAGCKSTLAEADFAVLESMVVAQEAEVEEMIFTHDQSEGQLQSQKTPAKDKILAVSQVLQNFQPTSTQPLTQQPPEGLQMSLDSPVGDLTQRVADVASSMASTLESIAAAAEGLEGGHGSSDESEEVLLMRDSPRWEDEEIQAEDNDEPRAIKAEIKLLVKTTEVGKESIEIRSIREFVDLDESYKSKFTGAAKTELERRTPSGDQLNRIQCQSSPGRTPSPRFVRSAQSHSFQRAYDSGLDEFDLMAQVRDVIAEGSATVTHQSSELSETPKEKKN